MQNVSEPFDHALICMINKPTIAFGPELNRPSWDWAGFDIGREMSKYYSVIFFDKNVDYVPQCDLVIFIKNKPDSKIWENAKHRSIKIVYCPIDVYRDQSNINSEADFLRECEAVLVHCERLLPTFKPFCKIIEFVEHHNRFGLSIMTPYKESGYVVWVGGFQNLSPAIRWLKDHPLGLDIKFVTDYPTLFKDHILNVLPITDSHELVKWSPKAQRDTMAGAKAAFDVKGLNFNQMHKPPVKAQKFIASGIPFATNLESYSAEYFETRGFTIASLTEVKRWLSHEYWQETKDVGAELQRRLTLKNVGLNYKRIIDNILKSE
jgi:hypothetical protein